MTWTAQLTYTARDLTPDDIASLTDQLGDDLGDGGVVYRADTEILQIVLEVTADTLQEASDAAQRTAAAATGLLKPTRLYVLPTIDFTADAAHPPVQDLDLIGLTEAADILGVSRQRAGKLADDPVFPQPVVPGTRRLYTRRSIEIFNTQWKAHRNPRGGPRPRRGTGPADVTIG